VMSWVCWMLSGRAAGPRAEKFYATALSAGVLVVSWTGYRGGQISQGEEHLTEYMPAVLRRAIGLSDKEPLVQAAAGSFYLERVQPILADRCVNCHGRSKQKSGLRLDSYGWLMRGGKHGAAIKAGNAQGSDLIRRITLSPDQDDFMPKEKRQPLAPEQVKIIEAWIVAGASGTLPLEAIKNLPQGGSVAAAPIEVSFPEINEAAVAKQREGIVSAVAKVQSRYPDILNYQSRNSADLALNASLLGAKFGDDDITAFAPVAEHITAADFSRTAITDRSAPAIAAMKHLRVLRLADTKITDATLKAISGLDQLQSLNVYATGVTAASLPSLEKLSKLEHFYAGQTAIQSATSVPPGLTGKLVIDSLQRDSKK
jgi:Planctomycete cytochrome C